jgi:hypothetical protein
MGAPTTTAPEQQEAETYTVIERPATREEAVAYWNSWKSVSAVKGRAEEFVERDTQYGAFDDPDAYSPYRAYEFAAGVTEREIDLLASFLGTFVWPCRDHTAKVNATTIVVEES